MCLGDIAFLDTLAFDTNLPVRLLETSMHCVKRMYLIEMCSRDTEEIRSKWQPLDMDGREWICGEDISKRTSSGKWTWGQDSYFLRRFCQRSGKRSWVR